MTREFAEQHDFDIDPIIYIGSFIGRGILHLVDENVEFSLPFMESYLLAVELGFDDKTAVRYFDVEGSDFDLSTFDLYAEIGANREFVSCLTSELELSCEKLKLGPDEEHILLTD